MMAVWDHIDFVLAAYIVTAIVLAGACVATYLDWRRVRAARGGRDHA